MVLNLGMKHWTGGMSHHIYGCLFFVLLFALIKSAKVIGTSLRAC